MNIDLQLTAIDLNPQSVNFAGADYLALVADTQGNILKPHGRDFAQNLFFQFIGNPAAVKTWLKNKIAPLITSAAAQSAQTAAFKANGSSAGFVNAALSADGYRALGFVDTQLPSDPSFLRGMKNPDTTAFLGLNDPPVSAWQSGFQQEIHLLIALADDDQARLAQLTQTLIAGAATIATLVDQEPGQVMRNDRGQVIEHFGFTDGVSQPLFLADDIEKARLNDGIDVYDPSAPLGLALLKDPMGSPAGYGSYFVFRKLAQNVAGFRQNEAQLACALGLSGAQAELAGAYVVGRFRDGTPVVAQAVEGTSNEPNNFNFDRDADGMRCPFQAHIRKTNPRGDKVREFGLPQGEDRSRRIARRGVSYGPMTLTPPADTDVGLLFMSAQSSIVNQFEFIQAIWSNFTDFLRPNTGLDPVIGQGKAGAPSVPQPWPKTYGVFADGNITFTFEPWVSMRGGEYFFLPSLSFFNGLA